MHEALDFNTLIHPSIFRTYDIRGIVGKTLTTEGIYFIGKAIASLVLEKEGHQLLVARDGRLSSPALIKTLVDGMLSTGCHVLDLGMVPTPLLYYATHVINKEGGVMLTGSHNPPEYNGLKTVINGMTLALEDIQGIYHRVIEKRFHEGNGHYHEINMIDSYITHVCQNVKLDRPLKIVVDAGNGVAGTVAPALFRALGCDVLELFCDVDGHFPYHDADPSQAENMQDLIRAVHAHKAEIGLAFDGDGDRLGVVTNQGKIIWPDRLLMLFAQALLLEHPRAKIIFDVKCSDHLAGMIHALGGEPIMWKTGHSLIKAKLAETQAKLAGEMSGHFFFKDRWYGFDDALYAGARLLEILAKSSHNSDQLFAAIPDSVNTPEIKIAVAEEEKFEVMDALIANAHFFDAKEITTIDGLRVNFTQGFGLVRPSNTTPCLVLRFEAVNETLLKNIQTLFRQWILSVKPDLVVPF